MTARADRAVSRDYARPMNRNVAGTLFAGGFGLVIGLTICLVGLDILPAEEGSIHAPRWVLVLCGAVFALAGIAILVQGRPLLTSLIGNLIIAAFAAIAAWVAWGGTSEGFSGGVPFVSHGLNVKIARGMFGAGALLCALILIPGIRHTLKLLTED